MRVSLHLLALAGFLLAYPRWSARAQMMGDDAILQTPSDIERLTVVQTVSTTQKNFVLRLGMQDGVMPGSRSLFSTDKVSIVGECVQSSREYSLWKPWEPQANVPFKKGQIITYNNNLDSIWTKIPELQETLEEKKRQLLTVPPPYWVFRYSLAKTMNESTTETDAERTPDRKSNQFEFTHNRNLYKRLDWGAGLRYDKETATLKDPNLVIPTNRYFAYGEISFHFDPRKQTMNHLYAAAGMGLGMSNTKVDEAISKGTSLLLPVIRVGFMTELTKGYSLLTEAVAESISSTEKFADGDVQKTGLINVKFSIGLRF